MRRVTLILIVMCALLAACFAALVVMVYRCRGGAAPAADAFQTEARVQVTYFSMKGCGHCKRFNPVWDQLVAATRGDAGVHLERLVVDDDADPAAADVASKRARDAGVSSFPTIQRRAGDKVTVYEGERELAPLRAWVAGN
jgi:hypothetical protein